MTLLSLRSVSKKAILLSALAFLLSAPLTFAAPPSPPVPYAIDPSTLTPEQRASFNKLTPEQQEALTHPTVSTMSATTTTTTTAAPGGDTSAPTDGSSGDLPLYVIIGIAVLVVLALGALVARRKKDRLLI